MRLQTENKLIETDDIKLQCGIFQGDSLSRIIMSGLLLGIVLSVCIIIIIITSWRKYLH